MPREETEKTNSLKKVAPLIKEMEIKMRTLLYQDVKIIVPTFSGDESFDNFLHYICVEAAPSNCERDRKDNISVNV